MIQRIKTMLLLLGVIIPAAFGLANRVTVKVGDNVPIAVISNGNNGQDRSNSISASINGHALTIVFSANLGAVTIKILNDHEVSIDCIIMETPNGYQCYIPLAGDYTVVFEFPDGDVYYGEFTVTD